MKLSIRVQARIIANALNCQVTDISPSKLDTPWLDYLAWALDSPPDESPIERWDAFAQEWLPLATEHEANYKLLLSLRAQAADPYPTADDLLDGLPELCWLWPGWIPYGLLSLLVAVPGTGKSYLGLDLCRRLISGTAFPDGMRITDPGAALYVDAENTPQIMRQRLADWTREQRRGLYYLRPDPDRLMLNLSEYEDRDLLLEAVYRAHPRLVVIDSYGSITLHGENSKEDVQQLLSFLSKLAIEYDIALLVIHHLRKRSTAQLSLPGMMDIDAIRGSSHIPAMARNVIGLQWVSGGADRNGPRKLQVIKSNLDRYPEPLGVWFDSHPDHPELAVLRYGPAPQDEAETPGKLEECASWLLAILAEEGPLAPAEIVELGLYENYSRATIYRARKTLGDEIHDTAGWRNPANQWSLADSDEQDD